MKKYQITRAPLVAFFAVLLCGLTVGLSALPACAQAQQTPLLWTIEEGQSLPDAELNALWDKWSQRPVQRLNSVWLMETILQPNPKIDVAKEMARVSSQSKDASDEQQQQIADYNAEIFKAQREGTTTKTQVHVFRVGSQVKAEIHKVDELRNKGFAKNLLLIDFYNGDLAATIEEQKRPDDSPEKKSTTSKSKFIGIVTKNNPNETLSYSAIYESAVLLTGAKVSDYFPKSETRVSATQSQIFLDKKVMRGPGASATWFQKVRLVLSRSDLRPQAILTTAPGDATKWSFFDLVEDFVQVSGVALPSKVILGHRASDKPGGSKQIYTLQSVKINEEVDPSSVLLPRGVALTDYRFGEEQGVPYVIKDGLLLSDEQVKQLLGERSQTKAAGLAPSQQTVNHTPLMLMAGLGLISLGGVMWKKGLSSEK